MSDTVKLDIKTKTITITDKFTFKNALYLNDMAMYMKDVETVILKKDNNGQTK